MSQERLARARLSVGFLTFTLLLLGSCGACRGATTLTAGPPALAPALAPDSAATEEEAVAAARRHMHHTLYAAPHRRALALGELLVAGLILVGVFRLLGRRPTAVWWITQGAIAHGLIGIAQGARYIAALRAAVEERLPYLNQLAEVQRREHGTGALMEFTGHQLASLELFTVGCLVGVHVLFSAWVAWLASRENVRIALEEDPTNGR